MPVKPTERFSDRVENYVKYRPHYPEEIIDYLTEKNILRKESDIADIGSGTGILTELFLKNGNKVYGIEPNKEMREAGEVFLKDYTNFVSVEGTAESAPLEKNSADLIIAGQAFHWFDFGKAKEEFKRIMKPGGCVVLIWNVRKLDTTPFLKSYEEMLVKYGTDYLKIRHENVNDEVLSEFFEGKYEKKTFYNEQIFDFESLKGRLLSSSYSPTNEMPSYKPMLEQLQKLFDDYNDKGKIIISYDTNVYSGSVNRE